mmetsp:Transcript_7649/g.18238  ORF Transcript_7649/g.18238 Transcript_7649/m.18238 type:complete len:205 (-) Transcript_7649:41-655(-)
MPSTACSCFTLLATFTLSLAFFRALFAFDFTSCACSSSAESSLALRPLPFLCLFFPLPLPFGFFGLGLEDGFLLFLCFLLFFLLLCFFLEEEELDESKALASSTISSSVWSTSSALSSKRQRYCLIFPVGHSGQSRISVMLFSSHDVLASIISSATSSPHLSTISCRNIHFRNPRAVELFLLRKRDRRALLCQFSDELSHASNR